MEKHLFFAHYVDRFGKAYEKSIKAFSIQEQIHVTDQMLKILDCYAEEPVNYNKAKFFQEELYKCYQKKLKDYDNLKPTEYFALESMHHIELQYELKLENAGDHDNFFTEEERKQVLSRAQVILENEKRRLYMQSEPKAENHEAAQGVNGKAINGRGKRTRADNQTSLSQQQTALLIHYLQKAKIILPDNYLTNAQAGKAFDILTGYNHDGLRQALGKISPDEIATRNNLHDLENAITQLKILISADIVKERKKG